MKKNILVFPCGSEVALEIHRSLRFSTHFNLLGASSVKDHGRYTYENYIGDLPFFTDIDFLKKLKEIIKKNKIDAIFPAMDAVATFLKMEEPKLGCQVIGSSINACIIAASKSKTYKFFENIIHCPTWTSNLDEVQEYPVFIKPDVGYGSRNVALAKTKKEAKYHIEREASKYVFCEFLPGKEFTIDCFTNKSGNLLFTGARERARISNGISVNTLPTTKHLSLFHCIAEKINKALKPQGAWFFQMKEDKNGKPALLEVAVRLGGSSSLFRAQGVNFALLSAFDAFGYEVSICANSYHLEQDRALSNKYRLDIDYSKIYVDFDDCILINDKINSQLIQFLYQALNQNKKLVLITRHKGNLNEKLKSKRLNCLFDTIIHITDNKNKSEYINNKEKSIFIDDSHTERMDVLKKTGISVFSPDMIEALLK